ncbi:uncharacterized protein MONOS_13650 [Monocercomonoides exilis]|uniref:uncharacterized protein n=1 Tax=Monocercomonoides exilis TaxID=2049356 RepID=UPI003559C71B|nr:hypothetical protein MONOS_13650 [Monocercomonoides exilis]|eukprot:MONOS_13650.1-p1 / transcript=MONOS_13650.1 / gene=MONOS_13650 / organism=Monocercomonoides_exilis_PA203 / gene_product=unspecified product / transcript_product=unspecified product / location=Mono_scaffold00858:24103-24460(+) / protein_length=94 / sequence_SO=supercontig / SO=protein_coding / is_pseudo=false
MDTFGKRDGMHGTRLFEHLGWVFDVIFLQIEMEFQFKEKRTKGKMSENGHILLMQRGCKEGILFAIGQWKLFEKYLTHSICWKISFGERKKGK